MTSPSPMPALTDAPPPPARKNQWRQLRLILLAIVLGVLVFGAVLLLSDFSALQKYAANFPWWLMMPALLLRVANWCIRFVKWHLYLRLVGVRGLALADSAAIFWTGLPLALSPGKAAELLKSLFVTNLTGTPVATTIPVVLAERVSDGLAVVLLIVFSIANLAAPQYWVVVVIPLILFATGIIILQFRPLCLALLAMLGKLPVLGKFATGFAHFYESSYKIVRWHNLLWAVSMGVVSNILDGIGVFLILLGVGVAPSAELFWQSLLVISLSTVAGSVSGMPGAIGASDLTITGTLQGLVGLSLPQAGLATLLARIVQLWWGVLVGSLVFALRWRRLLTPVATPQPQSDN
jgi:glycosyltransferase 2 family protein